MAKQAIAYRLFYENNERAAKLSQEDYDAYLDLIDYMIEKKEPTIAIDIYMEAALNEFEAAAAKGKKAKNIIGKNKEAYIKKLKQETDYQAKLEIRKKKEHEGFMFSGVFMYLCAMLVCYFIREVLRGQYILGFYIDLIIAAVAAFMVATGFYQRRKICKRWDLTSNATTVDSFILIISVLVVYTMSKYAYDYSFLTLIGGFILSTVLMKKEFKEK